MGFRGVRTHPTQLGLPSFIVDEALISDFCKEARILFDTSTIHAVRVMLCEDERYEISHRDVFQMQSVAVFVERIDSEWLLRYLHKDSVESAFQPMVNPRTGQIEAYESLMRAVLPDGQIKTPAEMIASARSAGVMLYLDRVARTSAIRNAAKNDVTGTIFVNFNPSTTCDPDSCLQGTVSTAREAGIHPSRIVFEVTESECVTDGEHLKKILNFYRSNGFRIALDDLGSGYSSLNLMAELRPDFVKLDMALIRGIDRDVYKQEVTRSLLTLSHRLGISTVVEGVETEGEWNWATSLGADMIQGYYFARPAFLPPVGPDSATWSHELASPLRWSA